MVKPRPEASPHYTTPTWEKPQGAVSARKQRRFMMTGPGLLDEGLVQASSVIKAPVVEASKPARTLRFSRGTVLYAVVVDGDDQIVIPRNPQQERDLRRETLDFEKDLEVDREDGIVEGRSGQDVVRKVGTSQYGAFTVVHIEKDNGRGEIMVERRLASLTHRSLPRDNDALRFRKANQ